MDIHFVVFVKDNSTRRSALCARGVMKKVDDCFCEACGCVCVVELDIKGSCINFVFLLESTFGVQRLFKTPIFLKSVGFSIQKKGKK